MATSDDKKPFDDEIMSTGEPPTPKFLTWFHQRVSHLPADDHHSLGYGGDQAAPGDHNHDGVNSLALFGQADVPADLSVGASDAQMRDAINSILGLLRRLSNS